MPNKLQYRPEWHEGDPIPLCLCGCGRPVKMYKNVPYNYLLGHQPKNPQLINRIKRDRSIPIEKFREQVRLLMQGRNWKIADLARETKLNKNYLKSVMTDNRRVNIQKEWAILFFRRLAGLPTLATIEEQKRASRVNFLESEDPYGITTKSGDSNNKLENASGM